MNKRVPLKHLCNFVKGAYATLKTEPGEFPLVVTASYRRTANSFQMEGPAVCIPLVSSTGHGDAALHRVHYQEGKFALANLLVALTAKNPDQLLMRYLYHLLTAKKDVLLVPLMQGTANVSLKVEDIGDVTIFLLPIAEQRRIATEIEKLADKVSTIEKLQKSMVDDVEALCRSFIFSQPNVCTPTLMRDLVRRRPPDVTVQQDLTYQFAGVYCFGRGVFKGPLKAGTDFAYRSLTKLRTDDFVYPKLMAWEGALATVPSTCNSMVVSPEFPVFEIDTSKILPEVLDTYFRTPSVWPSLSGSSTGTNVRRRRLNPEDFLNLQIPVPPMAVQKKLAKVRERTTVLKELRVQTNAELNALLPSVLDRAFKGEL